MANVFPWKEEAWLPGVLSKKQVRKICEAGLLTGYGDLNTSIDYSSIDLHLSDEGYELLEGSIKPCGNHYERFLTDSHFAKKLGRDPRGYFNLHAKRCYVFKLKERFTSACNNKPIFAQGTAKSTVGRVDVIARLIVDGMHQYEEMEPHLLGNGTGQMYLEIIPITFNVRVKEGISLSQLRLFYGDKKDVIVSNPDFIKSVLHGDESGDGYLSVDVSNTTINGMNVAAFRAIPNKEEFINLWVEQGQEKDKPDPNHYWEFVPSSKKNNEDRLKIQKSNFYILKSKERIALPPNIAVYAKAMDESLGEMRIHYAGFVHPHFGYKRSGDKKGTPLIFEVRGHDVDVNLVSGEKLARLIFYRMSETDDGGYVSYGDQELELSKFFKKWETQQPRN